MVQVFLIFGTGTDTDFIHFEFGSGFYPRSPGPGADFINSESRSESGFRQSISFWSPDFIRFSPGPDIIEQIRILYISSPDFIKHVQVWIRVRILPLT